jgi:predicted transcriptional regulator
MDDYSLPGSGERGETDSAGSSDLEARRAELRAAVKRGLEDIEEGRVVDLEEALDRIEAMLDEMEAARPS